MITYGHEIPVKEYNSIRESVGWKVLREEQAQKGRNARRIEEDLDIVTRTVFSGYVFYRLLRYASVYNYIISSIQYIRF